MKYRNDIYMIIFIIVLIDHSSLSCYLLRMRWYSLLKKSAKVLIRLLVCCMSDDFENLWIMPMTPIPPRSNRKFSNSSSMLAILSILWRNVAANVEFFPMLVMHLWSCWQISPIGLLRVQLFRLNNSKQFSSLPSIISLGMTSLFGWGSKTTYVDDDIHRHKGRGRT